jgi:hypothetical protein
VVDERAILSLVGTMRDSDVARRTGAEYTEVRALRLRDGVPRYRGRHGTLSLYTHGRCRCDACCEAKRVYKRKRREAKKGGPMRIYYCHGCHKSGHNTRSCPE